MTSNIRSLPPSVFRYVAVKLELIDLERLYGTFDFELQRLVSFPGVLSVVRLADSNLVGSRWYLLRALRDVERVEALEPIKWSLTEFPLISALNPLELRLEFAVASKETDFVVIDHSSAPGSSVERRTGQNCVPFEFDRITPRLMHLELDFDHSDTALDHTSQFGSFPKTLTSLVLKSSSSSESKLFERIPSSLRSLCLQLKNLPINVALLASMFPLLEHLDVFSHKSVLWDPPKSNFRLPRLLTSLCVSVPDLEMAIRLFNKCRLRKTTLSKVMISINHQQASKGRTDQIDFDNLLPPTVDDFSLDLAPHPLCLRSYFRTEEHDWQILSMPLRLTSFSITLIKVHDTFDASTLTSLRQLQKLRIHSLHCIIRLVGPGAAKQDELINGLYRSLSIDASLLPRSLTSFWLHSPDNSTLQRKAIARLPPKLASLSLRSFDLNLLAYFNSCHPNCHLQILERIDLWNDLNGLLLRSSELGVPWTSSVYLATWSSAILLWCSCRGITLNLIPAGPHKPRSEELLVEKFSADFSADSIKRICGPDDFSVQSALLAMPNLRILKLKMLTDKKTTLHFKELPSSLTTLYLDAPRLTLTIWEYPKLTHIVTSSTIDSIRRSNLPNSLTYLNAPNWRLTIYDLSSWRFRGFNKLVFQVTHISDWQIASFIAGENFDAKTRFNMRLIISYELTGYLLPAKGVHHITMDLVVSRTEKRLAKQLRARMPSNDSLPSASSPSSPSTPKGARLNLAINRLFCANTKLLFPASSRVISILNPHLWQLCSHSTTIPRETPKMSSFKRLRRLELENAHWDGTLFDQLPSSLRFLRIKTVSKMDRCGECPPPNLEVLILAFDVANWEYSSDLELGFALSKLPSSLQHLCFTSSLSLGFVLGAEEVLSDKKLFLPNLKSVLLTGISPPSALVFRHRLGNEDVDAKYYISGQYDSGYHYYGWIGQTYPNEDLAYAAAKLCPQALFDQDDHSAELAYQQFYQRVSQDA